MLLIPTTETRPNSSTKAETPKPVLRNERKEIPRLAKRFIGPMLRVCPYDLRVIKSKITRVTKKAVNKLEMMPMHNVNAKPRIGPVPN